MMDQISLDPYEQQLLSVFDSYDHENCGSLDCDGLTQLCQTLQLEEQSNDLIKCLLKDPQQSRATFIEFKEALLNLLGNMQQKNNNKNDDDNYNNNKKNQENGSPDREVSPKFVYGTKKYGRRSRPKNPEEENDSPQKANVQRSNSQSEVMSKKRKTNYKLKRCTSLPGNHNYDYCTNDSDLLLNEEMLREAWKKLGVGKDGYLNQTELILVCDAIGLHKLAKGVLRQLSDKLLDFNQRISFEELLEILQQDDTWLEVLDGTPPIESADSTESVVFPDSQTFQFITLGPNGTGQINRNVLVEMWETIGITAPKQLLSELGFKAGTTQINMTELAVVLEREIKGLQEQHSHPHLVLLQANLLLYQLEIRCLKQIFEQINCEKDKLKSDVNEANNRAKLLAQEVDDNHIKMEYNTQNQVKLLEQRHSDLLRNLQEQYQQDKEQLTLINQNLERKIANLEVETVKLKNDLLVAQKYSMAIEKENHLLLGQVNELKQLKQLLQEQINCLEIEKQKYTEMEHEQLEPLLMKLSNLQMENAQLRDKNDEMVTEIELLTSQVTTMKTRVGNLDQSMEENVSSVFICEGLGAKRRSDYSPSKDTNLFVDGSPRLGKVRKFHSKSQLDEDENEQQMQQEQNLAFTSSESGFEADNDYLESSLINQNNNNEIVRLQAKITFLEQILGQHNIPIPSLDIKDTSVTTTQLKERADFLEQTLENVKNDLKKMINKNNIDCKTLQDLYEKLKMVFSNETKTYNDKSVEMDEHKLEELVNKLETENKELSTKCQDMENCVELLKNEYEKCEDYWQSKLDEERQMFEQEQHQNSEKLTDLISKMAEYEEQFTLNDSRLSTIDETDNLEKQFTDLEQEYEDYKQYSEIEIFKKDEEISALKQKLSELAERQPEHDRIASKMSNLSLCVVEKTSLFSHDAMPVPVWQKEAHSHDEVLEENLLWQNGQNPSTSSSSTLEKNSSTPCRPKRTRKHDRNNALYKKSDKDTKKTDGFGRVKEQMVALPVGTIHNLNGRLHHLEQRCRQLQMVLKQQHFYTEQTLQQCWQHHRGEKTELQCILRNQQDKLEQQVRVCNEQLDRLTRSDMLVKELYVENSYLIAKVQRLEQQCHFLAQYNSNSSSV